jgi:23S rRNA pseudouridine955/2504/2580 synthase
LLARSREAAAKLGRSLKDRGARKLYWALVIGVPRSAEGQIKLALVKGGGRGDERVHPADPGDPDAKPAVTRYAVMERAGARLAWLAMMPVTGRTHQLRAHAAAIGHPIVGDGKYGGADAHPGGEIARKLHLHARRIVIPHPRGGVFDISAALPQHMKTAWGLFGFDADDGRQPFTE